MTGEKGGNGRGKKDGNGRGKRREWRLKNGNRGQKIGGGAMVVRFSLTPARPNRSPRRFSLKTRRFAETCYT